jgi:two-component system nitrogen regulation response regulator GlnG
MDLLVEYSWPGNVRELQSTLRQAMLQAIGPVLLPEFLPVELRKRAGGSSAVPTAQGGPMSPFYSFIHEQIYAGTQSLYAGAVASMERILLDSVLRHTGGNQSHAARILGMTRGFLRNKIREHGIRITQSVSMNGKEAEAEANSCAPGPRPPEAVA